MLFRPKRDKSFFVLVFITVFIITATFLIPLIFDKERTILDTSIVLALWILSAGVMLWCAFDIKYVFFKDYLFVKGGFFRSRIPYGEITKVSFTRDMWTGYRVLSSREGIEICYQSAALGSVIISPQDYEKFLIELKKHRPDLSIQIKNINPKLEAKAEKP